MDTDFSNSEFWKNELKGTQLPDLRFFPNLVKMCESLDEKPSHSFSASCGPSVRKSAHRLFSKSQNIDIQSGHRNNTLSRSLPHKMILVAEDTTDINYNSHKNKIGMGDLGGRHPAKGLNMHTAMAMTKEGIPLGLIGQHIWAPKTNWRTKNHSHYPTEEKESYQWILTKKWVDELYGDYPGVLRDHGKGERWR